MKNIIYSIEEYEKQGFSKIEAPVARMADRLYNKYDSLSEKDKNKYHAIVKRLGL